jgi:excisionase family DNA binding protein
MRLSIKEAARLFSVSENKVRAYIVSGQLPVERKGRQILVPETRLKALLDADEGFEGEESRETPDRSPALPFTDALAAMSSRLTAVEGQIAEGRLMFAENQRLHEVLRERERQMAEKDLEIDKLRRDLVYQKRLWEKELEDLRRALEGEWAVKEKEVSEKIAHERELLEQRLIQEQNVWSERLAQEQERFAQRVVQLRSEEGFWARLVKMITWS